MSIFSRILVGVDASPGATEAVDFAARLAREHQGELLLCHSVDWIPVVADATEAGAMDATGIVDELKAEGASVLERAALQAKAAGIEPRCIALDGEPAQQIVECAQQAACTLIVMATHGRSGLHHLLVGSTTEAVLRRSAIPVLATRAGIRIAPATGRCFERILVGIDDSEPSDAALATVLDFPPDDRRSVLLCSVAGSALFSSGNDYPNTMLGELRAEAEHVVDAAIATARARGVDALGRVKDGRPEPALIELAQEERADLIVLGSHGRRGLRRLFLGSVAEGVVQAAPVPVLVVRAIEKVAVPRAAVAATLAPA